MKYTPLPLERELASLPEGDRLVRRNALTLDLFRHPGFQIVTCLLRDLEQGAWEQLKAGTTERAIGALQCIESIRASLAALLPGDEQPNVSWGDEGAEEWTGPIEPAGREV